MSTPEPTIRDRGSESANFGTLPTVALLALAAACRWYAFNPPAFPVLSVAWLALVTVAAIRARSLRTLLIAAVIVDFLWGLGIVRWIADVSVAGYPFLAGYLSLWGGVSVWLVRRGASSPRTWRIPLWVQLPIIVVALDFLRGEVLLGGYPWYEAGQSLAGWTTVAQAADLLGARGVSILAAVLAGAVAAFAQPWSERGAARDRLVGLAVAAGLMVAAVVYGGWRLRQAESLPRLGRFLAIQTALPIDNKIGWSSQRQLEDVPEFARLTLSAVEAAAPPIDLIAWPETMLPGFGLDPATLTMLEEGGYFPGRIFGDIAHAIALKSGVPLLVGSPVYVGLREADRSWEWDAHYNSVYLVPPAPMGLEEPPRYDKLVLTPFGETMPGISAFDWLEQALLDLGANGMTFDLSAGAGPVRFRIETASGPIRIATPICSEATVSWLCRWLVWPEGTRAADLLVNASNDGWLGDDQAARWMNLRIASLRAIENRTPMLRAVNTGYSAGIDSCGRVISGIGGSTIRVGTAAGWVVSELPRDDRRPLFAMIGDRWAWLAVVLVATGLVATRRTSGA